MSEAARREAAWQLAMLASLAARVEPQLLRRLRLAFAPWLDASAEAALWFSPKLVSLRAPTGLVLAVDALTGLRAALAADEAVLDAAWAVTADAHAAASPALQLEEELTYLALKGLERPEIEDRVRGLLRSAVRTLVERGGRLAEWADRAMPRLPPAILALEEAQMVARGAAMRLGRAGSLAALGAAANGDGWGWLAPNALRQIPMSVRWVENGIEFGPPGALLSHPVSIPALLPLAVHIWPDGPEAGPGEQVRLRPAQPCFVPVPPDTTHVAVQIFGGARIVLRRPNPLADKLQRVRRPRVHISYEVEENGTASKQELPFVVGVFGNFAGHGRAEGTRPLSDRKFVQVDRDNFDDVLARIGPTLRVPNGEGDDIALTFRSMEEFKPGRLAARIDRLRPLLDLRNELLALQQCVDRSTALERLLDETLADRASAQEAAVALAGPSGPRPRLAERLLALGDQRGLERLRDLVHTAVRHVLAWDGDARRGVTATINMLVTEQDVLLSAGLNPVMHDPAFLQLEGSWRGLQYLAFNTETGPTLKVRMLDVSKAEIAADLASDGEQGELHTKLYDQEFGVRGGEPFGVLVCDVEWDAGAADMRTLNRLAEIAAPIHAPVLSAAAPALLGLDSWDELPTLRDLSIFEQSPAWNDWRALRRNEASRHLVLTLPRVPARMPYGAATMPVDEFAFEEEAPPSHRCWMNSAYTLAERITHAFALHGWANHIRGAEGGGRVEGLPPVRSDGQVMVTEAPVSFEQDARLATLGLLPLIGVRNSDYAVFSGAQTVHRPFRYDREEATKNAALAARLPFVLAAGRFMQYFMVMSRDSIGSFENREDLGSWLNRWLANYVQDSDHGGAEARAKFPLREGRVQVAASDNGTEDVCTAWLRPWLDAEELTASMRVQAPVPGTGPGSAVPA